LREHESPNNRKRLVNPDRRGPGIIPRQNFPVARPAQGPADGAGLAHSAAVAPAAARERPGGALLLHDEHAAVQVAKEPPDGELAVYAGGRPAARHPEGARPAGHAAAFYRERFDGPDVERTANLV